MLRFARVMSTQRVFRKALAGLGVATVLHLTPGAMAEDLAAGLTHDSDIALWDMIKDLQVPVLVEKFIKKYPDSPFRPAAEAKLLALDEARYRELKSGAAKQQAKAAPEQQQVDDASYSVNATRLSTYEADIYRNLVLNIQFELKRTGCYQGRVDAVYGTNTQRAARQFARQSDQKLLVDTPSEYLLNTLRDAENTVCTASIELPTPKGILPKRDVPQQSPRLARIAPEQPALPSKAESSDRPGAKTGLIYWLRSALAEKDGSTADQGARKKIDWSSSRRNGGGC